MGRFEGVSGGHVWSSLPAEEGRVLLLLDGRAFTTCEASQEACQRLADHIVRRWM